MPRSIGNLVLRALAFTALGAALVLGPTLITPAKRRSGPTVVSQDSSSPNSSAGRLAPVAPSEGRGSEKKKVVPEMNPVVLDHYVRSLRSALAKGDENTARRYAMVLSKAGEHTHSAIAADPSLAAEVSRLTSNGDSSSSQENRQ